MLTNSTTFYVFRHAEAKGNSYGIIMGHQDYPLTDEGKRQALEGKEKIKGLEFAAAFSSDLSRSEETAKILISGSKIDLQTTPLLREQNYGRIEGQNIEEAKEDLQKEIDEFNSLSDEQKMQYQFTSDFEQPQSASDRFKKFLLETAKDYPGKNVLVVTHSAILRALLVSLDAIEFGKVLPNIPNMEMYKFEVRENDISIVK